VKAKIVQASGELHFIMMLSTQETRSRRSE
jgi:hypothetical protein